DMLDLNAIAERLPVAGTLPDEDEMVAVIVRHQLLHRGGKQRMPLDQPTAGETQHSDQCKRYGEGVSVSLLPPLLTKERAGVRLHAGSKLPLAPSLVRRG